MVKTLSPVQSGDSFGVMGKTPCRDAVGLDKERKSSEESENEHLSLSARDKRAEYQ